jgi:hypothetical protein
MLLPVETETFFEAIQDEEPLLISRPNNRTYFDGLFSRAGVACSLAATACQLVTPLPTAAFGCTGPGACRCDGKPCCVPCSDHLACFG